MYFVVSGVDLLALIIRSLFAVLWAEMISRTTGPLAFRFMLQLLMASVLAVSDELNDAQLNRTPFLLTIVRVPADRQQRLLEGLSVMSRVFVIAIGIDFLYQYVALAAFRPLHAIIIGIFWACIPYLIFRGPAIRPTRWIRLVPQREGKAILT